MQRKNHHDSVYIKGYYGFGNFGDELLFLGVVRYLDMHISPKYIYIEVGNVDFFQNWIDRHQDILGDIYPKIHILANFNISFKNWNFNREVFGSSLKVIGGGECISNVNSFPYGGWKYLLGFCKDWLFSNYMIIGGIGTPSRYIDRILYRLLLSRAKNIVVRDQYSQAVAQNYYSKHVYLYHDFAIDIINIYQSQKTNLHIDDKIFEDKYILINMIKADYVKIGNFDTYIDDILNFVSKYPDHKIIFFPNQLLLDDNDNDYYVYKLLQQKIDGLIYFDWSIYHIFFIIKLFENCVDAMGARLHFLIVLHILGHKYTPIVYQEKVKKILNIK